MRYHFEKPLYSASAYGETFTCAHPIYDRCTLYRIGDRGLAVIQQRFDIRTKQTRWTEIDAELTDAIYLNRGFRRYFEEHAGTVRDGLWPTVTVRQIMWALRMKPLPKERWETVFDRKDI